MRQVFESENISFAELDESLVKDYLAMVNDMENVGRLIGSTRTFTEEEEISWIRRKLENKFRIFSMIAKDTGEFIGNIEIMDVEGDETSGELGICITAKQQDRGFGSEAIPAMVKYAAKEYGLKRFMLKVFPFNDRAVHVYEKCGFKEYDRAPDDIFMEIIL